MSTETITQTSPQTAPPPALADGTWRIDPARSRIEFRAGTLWGLARVRGQFERYRGTLDLQRSPAIELTIEAGSLTTGNTLRDRHLRSGDFFDVEHHPQVRFVSDSAKLEGGRLKVRGRLEAAGSSLPLELEASLRSVGGELEIDVRTEAEHRRLGMSHGMLGMIPAGSELHVHGRLVR